MNRWILLFGLFICAGWIRAQQMPYINYTTHSGLPQIQVRALHQDPQGYIWVGTKSGLVKFNGQEFEHFLPNQSIQQIKSHPKGEVYFQTSGAIYQYDGTSMQQITAYTGCETMYPASGGCWIACSKTFDYWQDGKKQLQLKSDSLFPGHHYTSFAFDQKKNSLFFTLNQKHSIYSITPNGIQSCKPMPVGDQVIVSSLSPDLIAVKAENNGATQYYDPFSLTPIFSVYKQNNQVNSIEIHQLPLREYLFHHDYHYYLLDSLTHQSKALDLSFIKAPYPVIIDRDNNIWSGSDNGLYQIFNGPIRNYPRSFMNDFWTLIKASDDQFYGAVYKEGLYQLNFEDQSKTEIIAPGLYGKKEIDYYYGASATPQGAIFFPTHNGLVKLEKGKTEKFNTGISLITQYDSVSGQVLFGQMHGLGFIDSNNRITYATDHSRQKISGHPKSINLHPNGEIWIGTNQGLCRYNRQDSSFNKMNLGPRNGVVAMCRDHHNNLWMGGKDGLWIYETSHKRFTRIDKNIIRCDILAIMAPTHNLLVVGTSQQLFVLNLKEYYTSGIAELKLYNYRNGFLSEEVCQNGFLRDENRLYIPSTTCTSVLDLDQIHFDPGFFDVYITALNGKKLNSKTGFFVLERGCNELDFNFEAIGFGLPNQARFKYLLEGVDSEWSQWTTRDYANYRNLKSGTYRFRVMSRAGGLLLQAPNREAILKVKISLPFYKEPDFYQHALYLFLVLGLLLGFFVYSRYRIKMKVFDRERKIKYLEIATLQAQLNPHFIFNFLSSVQNLISLHAPEKANQYLIKFSRLIRAYMEVSIKTSRVLYGMNESSEITIQEEIDLLKTFIELEQIKHKTPKIQYEIHLSSADVLHKTIPPMIIQPLVENAIKHGLEPKEGLGHLDLHFKEQGDGIVCLIQDDGIGRAQSQKIKEQSIRLYKSRGIDLINKKINILNQLGHHIKLEYHDLDVGTMVNVYFNN